MLTQLAALGIGLVTLVGAPAVAAADCTTTQPSAYPSSHPSAYPNPYPGAYPQRPPRYTPAPLPGRGPGAAHAVVLQRADFNHDGGISFNEAQAYGRTEFSRADHDRNGVLTRPEIHFSDELARGARGRDGIVTFAEYDGSLRRQFAALDRNRDGFVSRHELGRRPASNAVTYSWNWQL